MDEKPKLRRNASNPGNMGKGRPKGTPNKTTALMKDAIIQAAEAAGGAGGMVGYLTLQAMENPGPFMALMGKVLPMQIADADGGKIVFPSEIILRAAHDHRND